MDVSIKALRLIAWQVLCNAPLLAPRRRAAFLDPFTRRQDHTLRMDHGWTHWIFDTYRIPYTIITGKDLANATYPLIRGAILE